MYARPSWSAFAGVICVRGEYRLLSSVRPNDGQSPGGTDGAGAENDAPAAAQTAIVATQTD